MSNVAIPTKTIDNGTHRELVYSGLASEKEHLYLRLGDSSVLGNEKGYYSIPLYVAQTQEQDSNEADVELVHIYPSLFDTVGMMGNEVSFLPEGYVYIYVDGFLWRELEVVTPEKPGHSTFKDVNLGFQKGYMPWKQGRGKPKPGYSGKREATGEELTTIIVPHKIRGRSTRIEITT